MRAPSPALITGAGLGCVWFSGFLCLGPFCCFLILLWRRGFFLLFFGWSRLLRFRWRLLFRFSLLFFFLFGFLLRLFCFFFWGSLFSFATDKCDLVTDVYFAAFFDIDLGERSVFRRLPLHRRLVRF